MSHVFICYTHEDTPFVDKLSRKLIHHHITVWLDWHNIPAADDDWQKTQTRALKTSDAVVVILSPAALNSWLVSEQVHLALTHRKPIIPVISQPCNIPPSLLASDPISMVGTTYQNGLLHLIARLTGQPVTALRAKQPHLWAEDVRWWLQYHLLPLLWPGWLGLLLVVALLVLTSTSYTLSSRAPTPTVERLAVLSPTATPLSMPTPVDTNIRVKDGSVMLYIPAGEFLRGGHSSDDAAEADEFPAQRIYLDAFWLDRTEVSNVKYALCVAAGDCAPALYQGSSFEADHLPVVGVDWYQAQTYCEWVGGRLPTEAEWEKAARGFDMRPYPWGYSFEGTRLNSCDAHCVADWRDSTLDDGYRYTAPVGNYPAGASVYGVLDMSGNVWEWTADWYADDYYAVAPPQNPAGPATGRRRVMRGGGWLSLADSLRLTNRHHELPDYRHQDTIGFRCATNVSP